jgi:hypothetical protein
MALLPAMGLVLPVSAVPHGGGLDRPVCVDNANERPLPGIWPYFRWPVSDPAKSHPRGTTFRLRSVHAVNAGDHTYPVQRPVHRRI